MRSRIACLSSLLNSKMVFTVSAAPDILKDYRHFSGLNRSLGEVVWWLRRLYYIAEMVSGTSSWVLFWFVIAMNTLKTGLSLRIHIRYRILSMLHFRYTLDMNKMISAVKLFVVWLIGKQYEFQTWSEGRGYTVGSDDAIICDCVKCQLRASFHPYPHVYITPKWSLFANTVTISKLS